MGLNSDSIIFTPDECQAPKELENNPEIMIKLADKGFIIVMHTKMYIAEERRQLSNDTHYRPLLYDPTSRHNEKSKMQSTD